MNRSSACVAIDSLKILQKRFLNNQLSKSIISGLAFGLNIGAFVLLGMFLNSNGQLDLFACRN